MPIDQDRLEIERIENLLVNFDWKTVKQEITDDDIVLTIKKKRVTVDIELGAGAS
jgi:uncharacterized membrane protein YgcG